MPRILIVDDEPTILNLLNKILTGQGYDTTPASNGEKALQLLESEAYDLMISDINMTPINGMELLRKASKSYPDMGVIMLTAYGTVGTAVEAMKEGAFDYITKPFKLDELVLTVQRALEYNNALTENKDLKARLEHREQLEGIVAESPGMRKVCDMIERVAPTSATVLVYGESGTGKELVARALHHYSPRKDETFMAINCAALPAQLMESEMFGHVKGAFTGATSTKAGLFETAHGGTLFLDEISSMPLEIQSKLLRVLQDKQVRKVGGSDHSEVDVRIIAASNEKLENLIEQGKFREDLYYRLSVISIDIPPLRKRPEDILPLVDHILRKELGTDTELPMLDHETQNILDNYNWPGNVRELENTIQHALAFVQDGTINKNTLPAKIVDTVEEGIRSGVITDRREMFKGKSLKAFLHEKEKEFLQKTIESMNGDKEKAAEELGISLATLYRKLPQNTKKPV
ncbi:sigma-54-dependent transcriptional regulator [Tichowtungia aerotolerans]|uniref:Response regulator n=1 Tax=Tichowtungia aerotolerans TaxID=2697043 RepID=A0A6P1M9X0_9BACT|nr:sigma-54 dependent transcriptional regulator [Tichowtungia aerotolerans]QHI70842.1 response regulator [Tichowtungia aerotolerans]